MLFQSTYYADKDVLKFYNTFNINLLKDFLDGLINNKDKNTQKSIQYISMHENNIAAILNLLGYSDFYKLKERVINPEKQFGQLYGNPQVASSLIFEVLRDQGKVYIRLKFNNEVIKFQG